MRSYILRSTLIGMAALSSSALANPVEIEAERLFVPTGFDDNDQVEVVVDGMLPSTCYELVAGEFISDDATRTVTLIPKAIQNNSPCLQVLVPYSQVFNLSVMPYGSYDIKVRGVDVKRLTVAEATNAGPDDVLYASIDNAYVEALPVQSEHRIVLEGNYTNSCMVWNTTQIVRRDPEVVEVLPTVRMLDREDCEDRTIPFKGVSVKLPKLENKGRYLLHVRSMHGNSVNRVFSYDPE